MAAILVLGGLAGGCVRDAGSVAAAYGIPTPSPSLLRRQADPKCKFFSPGAQESQDAWSPYAKKSGKSAGAAADGQVVASGDRRKQIQNLVSERDCYRRAEARVRRRLHKLQGSVTRTVKALQTSPIEGERQVVKRP
ncbi:MAG: hypothetical protein ACR2PO_03625 [Methyloligellaceae bacterium]